MAANVLKKKNMHYNTTNPCFSCCNTPAIPTPCKRLDCICFCDVYISPKSELASICNVQGVVDLKTFSHDVSVCDTTEVKYQLMMFDTEFFTNVVVFESGMMEWIPSPTASKVTGNLVFKVYCGELAKLVTMTIGRKSNCIGVSCPIGYSCNDCSGICIPNNEIPVDLTIDVEDIKICPTDEFDLTITVN